MPSFSILDGRRGCKNLTPILAVRDEVPSKVPNGCGGPT
jgi:hypothetical protein